MDTRGRLGRDEAEQLGRELQELAAAQAGLDDDFCDLVDRFDAGHRRPVRQGTPVVFEGPRADPAGRPGRRGGRTMRHPRLRGPPDPRSAAQGSAPASGSTFPRERPRLPPDPPPRRPPPRSLVAAGLDRRHQHAAAVPTPPHDGPRRPTDRHAPTVRASAVPRLVPRRRADHQLVELLWVRDAWALATGDPEAPPPLTDAVAAAPPGVSPAERAEWDAAWPGLWRAAVHHAGLEPDTDLRATLHRPDLDPDRRRELLSRDPPGAIDSATPRSETPTASGPPCTPTRGSAVVVGGRPITRGRRWTRSRRPGSAG